MSKYLSPKGISEAFQVSKPTAYRILKRFEQSGGEVIRIGKLPRVSQEQLIEFLRGKHEKAHSFDS
jgi:transposase